MEKQSNQPVEALMVNSTKAVKNRRINPVNVSLPYLVFFVEVFILMITVTNLQLSLIVNIN